MQAVTPRRTGVTVFIAALAVVGGYPAHAGDDKSWEQPPARSDKGGGGGGGGISATVQYKKVNVPSGGAPMVPAAGAAWQPPPCWYVPRYTPKQFDKVTLAARNYPGSAAAELTRKYGEHDFNKGRKGLWWELEISGDDDGSCNTKEGFLWIGPKDPPPPDAPVIDPEILAGLAYRETKLPAPPLELSPPAGRQIVNLKTYASFARKLPRVWVTASLDYPGGALAATTTAVPTKLRLEAGSAQADPSSCSYDLRASKGSYGIDTKGAGCNITYRRASGDSGSTLTAYVTWKVHWNEGESPDGGPQHAMPSGTSDSRTAVTVKEVQSIVRD